MPMLPTLAALLLVATGVAAYSIKAAADLDDRSAVFGRSAMTASLALVTAVACWAMIRYPAIASMRSPGLYGEGWDCAYYGKGGTVCFKKQ